MDDPVVSTDRADRIAAYIKPIGAFVDEYTPVDYVIEPQIQSGCLITMTASTGAGKTAWAIVASLAVATGRADILGRTIEQGRVVFIALENPAGTRMRLMSACAAFEIDPNSLGSNLCVMELGGSPASMKNWLSMAIDAFGPIRLVVIDTLAAAFSGEDINHPTQAGNFVRELRPITQLAGHPAVLVLAHPRKEAAKSELIPHGAGAILNEVDANLCLWRDPKTSLVELHWQVKFRGPAFEPMFYRYADTTSSTVLNAKGVPVPLTTLRPCGGQPELLQAAPIAESKDLVGALVRAMLQDPKGTLKRWGDAIARSKSSVNELLGKARDRKLVVRSEAGWIVTDEGRSAFGSVRQNPNAERSAERVLNRT